MNKKLLLLVALSGIFAWCATQPPAPDEIKIANKDRLYDQNLLVADSVRFVPVRITRDVGLKGFAATIFLKIDGQYVVWLNVSEEITIYLAPGGYVFELVHSLCPDMPSCNKPTDVTIKDGFSNNFKIQVDDGFSLIRSKT